MNKRILTTIFSLGILLLSAGCQTKSQPVDTRAPDPVAPVAAKQEPVAPNLNESAIIALLAVKNNQDATKYQLHDVKQSGDYQVGSWSVAGNLSTEKFWAFKESSSWRLVYVGREMPACELLSAWPAEIKAGCRDDLNNKQISNFSQCVTAGGRIEETKPRRCLDDTGNIFVEVLMGAINKRYISQDLSKCTALDFDCAIQEKRFLDEQGCGCQK